MVATDACTTKTSGTVFTAEETSPPTVMVHSPAYLYLSLLMTLFDTEAVWIDSPSMARMLGVSLQTLHRWRCREDAGSLFLEGRHYRRSTPHARSNWMWHRQLAEKAWTQRSGRIEPEAGASRIYPKVDGGQS